MLPLSVWAIPHKADRVEVHVASAEEDSILHMRVGVRSKTGTYLSKEFSIKINAGAPPKILDLNINLKEISAYRIDHIEVGSEWPPSVRVVLS